MITNQFKNSSNYMFRCPVQPGFYYATNIPLEIEKYIPSYVLQFFKGITEVTIVVKAKTALSNMLTQAFMIRVEEISV